MIPWAKPSYWGREVEFVNKALDSTWISGGSYVDALEEYFVKTFDKKHALATSNGTTAIHLAYLGAGIQPGDEIILPGFCFLAAANIALHIGAVPVFCEVDENTWCMDVGDLEKKITSKTKAIIPVHTYGNVCDMDSIVAIAQANNLIVIEDCAESLFSKYRKRYSGNFGLISTFSFQATKTITTGEGGMVITDNDRIAERMRLFRSHGMNREKVVYWHELPGHNFRLTNIQAALGVAQLENRSQIIGNRQRVYNLYKERLQRITGVQLQKINANVEVLIWAIAVKLDINQFVDTRDGLMTRMKNMGIETRPGFYASSVLNIYSDHKLSTCEDVSSRIISFPSFPTLTEEQINFICDSLESLHI
jgi:perosamine synthetase